ncbi:uncharacterized protein LOC135331742 [Halichondria panicea]|uniref:uncharacterized protein LOC135331742 n=1 Tax=Halichondria panicea TaxID=6063 RepID=UPI00312B3583
MMIGLLFVVASLQLVACVPINTTVAVSPMDEQAAQQEQQDIACLLRDNAGKRSTFYTAVRAKHGFQDTPVRSLRPKVFQSDSVRCFSQRQCPESEITWCFNLYHPSKCIEVCWDSSGNVINMTENGLPLELDSVFSVTNGCLFSGGDSCVELKDTPFFVDGGLLTCTAESSSCVHKSFISITVDYVGLTTDPPTIQFHNASSELVLGEQNIYLVSAEYPTEPIDFFFGFSDGLTPYINGEPVAMTIPQDGPFCEVTDGCLAASPQYDNTRTERVRFYSSMVTDYGCPATSRTFYSWLVIDDAQEADDLVEYRFRASVYVYDPYPHQVYNEFTLNLSPVDQPGSGEDMTL